MMELCKNTVSEMSGLAFIYSGLDSISGEGRNRLKDIAQSLLAIQNHPGTPMPESIWREIMSDVSGKLP